jgi:hypothetical protein
MNKFIKKVIRQVPYLGLSAMAFLIVANTTHARTLDEIIDYIVENAVNPIITLLLALATLVFMWGLIEFLFIGAANEEKRTDGKKHMIWGLAGMLIMFSVYAIIEVLENFFQSIQ